MSQNDRTQQDTQQAANSGNVENPGVELIHQYLKKISFNSHISPLQLREVLSSNPSTGVSISVNAAGLGNELYEVIINSYVSAKTVLEDKNQSPHMKNLPKTEANVFDIEIMYGGLFKLNNFKPKDIEMVLLVYCPSIMFPFLRKIIFTTTTDAGFAPLMLELVDFSRLYNDSKKASQKAPQPNQ